MFKKITASVLGALLLCMAAVPVSALQTENPIVHNVIQPRYANLYQSGCTLFINSDGSAKVNGWVDYVTGNNCTVKLILERNGVRVKYWSTASTNGYINLSKTVTGLTSGSYQAILYITCGVDEATVESTVKVL